MALASTKSVGGNVDGVQPSDITNGRKAFVIHSLREIFRCKPLHGLNFKERPYLIGLKNENEEVGDVLKLSSENILMRWFNFHLKNAGNPQGITNFDSDLAVKE